MSVSGCAELIATSTAYGNLAEASPYQVVQLMLDAVLSRIAEASGHIERGEIAAKGEKIGKALGIIEALMLGLDKAARRRDRGESRAALRLLSRDAAEGATSRTASTC